ncbi:uncharacterized protein LOC131253294 [Magnolia sinica]|uniref:uncharacterized protein LOC131253294 n=1 Tax=Magnolia sinica TaxID=86752 RepID=UPI0026584ED7|nr:uncharacterized protein LOC131253294 [Magnolia sinica]
MATCSSSAPSFDQKDIMAMMDLLVKRCTEEIIFTSPLGENVLYLSPTFSPNVSVGEVQPLDPFFPICPGEEILIKSGSIPDATNAPKTPRTWSKPLPEWEDWFVQVLSHHEESWRNMGIFECIKLSLLEYEVNPSVLLALSTFWSSSTHTFVFGCGQMSSTIKDVCHLTKLLPFGMTYYAGVAMKRRKGNLSKAYKGYTNFMKAQHKFEGPFEEDEHVAFFFGFVIICYVGAHQVTSEYVVLAEYLA